MGACGGDYEYNAYGEAGLGVIDGDGVCLRGVGDEGAKFGDFLSAFAVEVVEFHFSFASSAWFVFDHRLTLDLTLNLTSRFNHLSAFVGF